MPSTEPQQPQRERVEDLPEPERREPLDAEQAEQVKGGIVVIDGRSTAPLSAPSLPAVQQPSQFLLG
jgi:hypothetical protein